jgi:hypothetical protein
MLLLPLVVLNLIKEGGHGHRKAHAQVYDDH